MEIKKNIRLFQPVLGKPELKSIKRVFNKSWIGYGEEVKRFEKEWSKKFNVKNSIAVNSCTAALHLALLCNEFKKGKKYWCQQLPSVQLLQLFYIVALNLFL